MGITLCERLRLLITITRTMIRMTRKTPIPRPRPRPRASWLEEAELEGVAAGGVAVAEEEATPEIPFEAAKELVEMMLWVARARLLAPLRTCC